MGNSSRQVELASLNHIALSNDEAKTTTIFKLFSVISVEKLQINLPASALRALAPSARVVPNKSVLSGNF